MLGSKNLLLENYIIQNMLDPKNGFFFTNLGL